MNHFSYILYEQYILVVEFSNSEHNHDTIPIKNAVLKREDVTLVGTTFRPPDGSR